MYEYKYKKIVVLSPETLFYGDFDYENITRAVILNSRQTKTPSGNEPWVKKTVGAVQYTREKDFAILTSTGMNTWELACAAAGNQNTRQIIIEHINSEDRIPEIIDNILAAYDLNPSNTGWLFYKSENDGRSPKSSWPIRDKLALDLASKIIPISIRPDGNLSLLIDKYRHDENVEIIENFKVEYNPKKPDQAFKPELVRVAIPRKKWNFITHWTRTCYGPWPGEKSADFYRRLIASGNDYPQNALETLKQILKEKVIRGSGNNLRAGLSGVSFSSLHPADVLPLMGWRKRLVRWNFEPYGLAIARSAAIEANIQPVIYGKPEIYDQLVETDKPYFQNQGSDGGAWKEEQEWRYLGDLDLSRINHQDMRIIVFRPAEMVALRNLTDVTIVSYT